MSITQDKRVSLDSELERLRSRIDAIDSEIIRLLEERLKICREIGLIKKSIGLKVSDKAREEAVLKRAGVFQEVFRAVIELCKSVQASG